MNLIHIREYKKKNNKQARLDRKYELYKNYLACCNLEEVML